MKILKYNEKFEKDPIDDIKFPDVFKGCTVGEFIEMLKGFPQDAIIEQGNSYHYRRSVFGGREDGNIFMEELGGENESEKRVILWFEE